MTTEGARTRRNEWFILLAGLFATILVGLLSWTLITVMTLSADMAVVKIAVQKDNQMIITSINNIEKKVDCLENKVNTHIIKDIK